MKGGIGLVVKRAWETAFRRCVWLLSRDRTAAAAARSCLVLAPHPDDETLGCGATILRKTAAGRSVWVVFACDGRGSHTSERTGAEALASLREAEARAACAVLGVDEGCLVFLRVPDGTLSQHQATVAQRIGALIRTLQPEEVYVCSGLDGHPDHRALSAVVDRLIVADVIGVPVFAYPVWMWDLRSWSGGRAFNLCAAARALRDQLAVIGGRRMRAVNATGLAALKRAALDCHRSQMGTLPQEPGWRALEPAFLAHFFGRREIHFELDPLWRRER